MEKFDVKKILFDHFDGRTTSMQRKLIEDWLKENTDNEVVFYQYLDEWEQQNPQFIPDTEKGWSKFEAVLNTPSVLPTSSIEDENTETPLIINNWWRKWLIAASICFLVAGSLFFFQKSILYHTYETGNAQTQNITLTDGTLVTLNANSKLYVPRWGFGGEKRTVLLNGEGEFHVTHTVDNKRFVIKTDEDFEVEVWGTQFVFYTRSNVKKVILNEGKVQINYHAGKTQIMKPGDVVTMDALADTIKLTKTNNPEKYSAWKYHQFYFDNTAFSEASIAIKERFGLQITFADSTLANRRLSGYFRADKPEELFKALSLLLNVSIKQRNEIIIISTK
ncbi:MAG: FecR domain-containing protein [Saprospiraceae bacterium]|nr:FecR domain-containing protein [Saprospiraceae bacterium]